MIQRLLSDIFSGVWLIDPQKAISYLPFIEGLMQGKFDASLFDVDKLKQESLPRYATQSGTVYTISEYGHYDSPEKAPRDSVAIINLSDVIYKYDMMCGPAGMKTKGNILQRCYANENIISVLMNMDTPGGESYASFLMAELIGQRNKPVIGFVDDLCCSAGYEIISACDEVIANSPLASIGSIGTYMTIADYEKYWEAQGIKLIEIIASKSKDKNKGYYDALKGDTSILQEKVDFVNEKFLADVKRNRGSKLADESVWGTGKVFFAEEAQKHGLIDEIDSFENVLTKLLN